VAFFVGLGLPGLQLGYISNRSFVTYGVITLTLVYTAYVTEVYRAGIESVHASQRAAARSLGLSYAQTMWYVIIPQAVRRVIPPLLNDFIGLGHRDRIGHRRRRGRFAFPAVLDAKRRLRLISRRRDLLHPDHDPARAVHRSPRCETRKPRTRTGILSANGNASTSFVQMRGVSKWFGALQVLNSIDLDVAEHNVVCLIGASGSGKSTLLRCLNRLERVEEGEIVIDGQSITARRST
jgi:ABC-type multidrug transport system fused ATPase/permease subunit